jgi:hypothetical protein
MNAGQAAGLAAAMCIERHIEPRQIATQWKLTRELQTNLVTHTGGLGVILWPYYDVTPDDLWFSAVNMLTVRGIWPGAATSLDFEPWRVVTRREAAEVLARAARNLENGPSYSPASEPHFVDIPPTDPDFPYIEGLVSWGSIPPGDKLFRPDETMDWNTLYQWLTGLHLRASRELIQLGPRMKPGVSPKLVRWELARYLWSAIGSLQEFDPSSSGYLAAGSDVDHDGIPDLEDALPFDRDNNGIPDRIDPAR